MAPKHGVGLVVLPPPAPHLSTAVPPPPTRTTTPPAQTTYTTVPIPVQMEVPTTQPVPRLLVLAVLLTAGRMQTAPPHTLHTPNAEMELQASLLSQLLATPPRGHVLERTEERQAVRVLHHKILLTIVVPEVDRPL